MHDDRKLSAYLVGLDLRSRLPESDEVVRVIAFGPLKSPGLNPTSQFMNGLVRTMETYIVDTKASDLFRFLKAVESGSKPTNAVYLVRDGTIVWENTPARSSHPHDIDGLSAAISAQLAD